MKKETIGYFKGQPIEGMEKKELLEFIKFLIDEKKRGMFEVTPPN